MARILIHSEHTDVEANYPAPDDYKDVSVPGLKRAGMQGLLAVTVAMKASELYAQGTIDLGYGRQCTVTDHIVNTGEQP